jgi:hypothetical protein
MKQPQTTEAMANQASLNVLAETKAQALDIYLDSTIYGTKRLYIWGLDTLQERATHELDALTTVLRQVCCWNGPDKCEEADHVLVMLSWELRSDVADSAYQVVKTFLSRMDFGQVKVAEKYRI